MKKYILSFILILVILVNYIYPANGNLWIRANDIWKRYKYTYISFLIIDKPHAGEDLAIGQINHWPTNSKKIINYIRQNKINNYCIDNSFDLLIKDRVRVATYPSIHVRENIKYKHRCRIFFSPISLKSDMQCKTKQLHKNAYLSICDY